AGCCRHGSHQAGRCWEGSFQSLDSVSSATGTTAIGEARLRPPAERSYSAACGASPERLALAMQCYSQWELACSSIHDRMKVSCLAPSARPFWDGRFFIDEASPARPLFDKAYYRSQLSLCSRARPLATTSGALPGTLCACLSRCIATRMQ